MVKRWLRTDVYGQIADRGEEDLDIRTGDKLGIHASRILKQRPPQERLRSKSSSSTHAHP